MTGHELIVITQFDCTFVLDFENIHDVLIMKPDLIQHVDFSKPDVEI
jgi:hypothetical protein